MFWDFLFYKKMMLARFIFQTALHSSLEGIFFLIELQLLSQRRSLKKPGPINKVQC